jgi:hypothetical protein
VKINLGKNIKTFLSWAYNFNLMMNIFAPKKFIFWTKKLMGQKFKRLKLFIKF